MTTLIDKPLDEETEATEAKTYAPTTEQKLERLTPKSRNDVKEALEAAMHKTNGPERALIIQLLEGFTKATHEQIFAAVDLLNKQS